MGRQLIAHPTWVKASKKLMGLYWKAHQRLGTNWHDIAKLHSVKVGEHGRVSLQLNKVGYFGFKVEVSWNGGAGYCVRNEGQPDRNGKTAYLAVNCRYQGLAGLDGGPRLRRRNQVVLRFHNTLPIQAGITNNWNEKPMVLYA